MADPQLNAGAAAAWRLTVSYRGDRYAGWQWQANAPTVQQALEEALERLLGAAVRVTGAGRTDAGVHARGQVVSLVAAAPAGALVHGTNGLLPEDVRVLAAAAAPAGFHARQHARAKEYRYQLRREAVLSPLDAPFAVRADAALDVAAMQAAAALLVGRHDFTAFAKKSGRPDGEPEPDPHRRIELAAWEEDGVALTFRIVGEGFLRGMVRGLVGTLLEVGRGRRTVDAFAALLAGRARAEAGANAPAHGLVLQRVDYAPEWLAGPAVEPSRGAAGEAPGHSRDEPESEPESGAGCGTLTG